MILRTRSSSIPTNAWPAFTSAAPPWNANRVVAEPPQRLEDERRLADAGVANDENRPRPGRAERAHEGGHRRDPAADQRRRRPLDRVDDASELAEEVDVDRRRLPLLERRPEHGPRRDVGAVDQLADERLQARVQLFELSQGQELPGRDPGLEEARDRTGERTAGPVLLRVREHGREHHAVALRERAEEQLPLAPVALLETALRRLGPARRRGHGSGAKFLRAAERDLCERVVVDALRIGEQVDELFEHVVALEFFDIDPRVHRRELLPDFDHVLDRSLLPPEHLASDSPPTLSRVQETLSVPNEVAAELAGVGDGVLDALRARLHCTLRLRGNQLTIEGDDAEVAAARAVVDELVELVEGGHEIGPDTVGAVASALDQAEDIREVFEDVVWRHRGKKIAPKTVTQKRYVDSIRDSTVTFAIGPAGTGKTYLAIALAVAALTEKQVGRIILTRPAIEAGERLGFLPGDMLAKVDPYMRPLFDALYDMMDPDRLSAYMERGTVEVAPLAFMRGRTLNDSFIILDEAQNTSPEQMQMFLTRLGFGSKVVVTGDVTQIDLPRDQASGLIQVRDILSSIEGIGFVEFSHEDVVRHKLVQRIVEAYKLHAEETGTARKR
jgi:phosphate starvation-inducible protein PhoH and related proteins